MAMVMGAQARLSAVPCRRGADPPHAPWLPHLRSHPQGPAAAEVVAGLSKEDLSKMYFSDFRTFDVAGIPCWLTRTG